MPRPIWKGEIDLKQLHNDARIGSISATEYATRLINILKTSRYADEDEILGCIEMLDEMADDESTTFNDTDDVLEDLYDWADEARVWIKTF